MSFFFTYLFINLFLLIIYLFIYKFICIRKRNLFTKMFKSFIYLLKKILLKKTNFYKKWKNDFCDFSGCHKVPMYPAIRKSNRT